MRPGRRPVRAIDPTPPPDSEPPREAWEGLPETGPNTYLAGLAGLPIAELRAIAGRLGLEPGSSRPRAVAEAIEAYWNHASTLPDDFDSPGARLWLGVSAVLETTTWPSEGISLLLGLLGEGAEPVLQSLRDVGIATPLANRTIGSKPVAAWALHPGVAARAPTTLPRGDGPPVCHSPVRQVRQADGLEAILRLGALWQRVAAEPLRQTQTGTLYKRDRERLADDPAVGGPIADVLVSPSDPVGLWLGLARGTGLIVSDEDGERLVAASATAWSEEAVHLPERLARCWLALTDWFEHPPRGDVTTSSAALGPQTLAFARSGLLLWLARQESDQWTTIADLAAFLERRALGWSRAVLAWFGPSVQPETLLEAILLGPAYVLGLVRVADEALTGRRAIQLSPLGRYILGLGPHPPPAQFPRFLYVQPNFEVIAYRQGLSAATIGQLSRFARWTQIGAATTLELSPEAVYRGLEGGLTSDRMIEILTEHSAGGLPPGVVESLRTWAGRRERVTYYPSVTLLEFADREAAETALAGWPASLPKPIQLTDRLLLVEDEGSLPLSRFKLVGSRDYRRPPEPCVEVEPDGVTLILEFGRSDLIIDAELARLADELPRERPGETRRRFRISRESLARAAAEGITSETLARWFRERTESEIPPATRLLWSVAAEASPTIAVAPVLLLQTETEALLDGLLQHPATREYLGQRLGPTAAVVAGSLVPGLRQALQRLGVHVSVEGEVPPPTGSREP